MKSETEKKPNGFIDFSFKRSTEVSLLMETFQQNTPKRERERSVFNLKLFEFTGIKMLPKRILHLENVLDRLLLAHLNWLV